jgi:hypothetical protein
MTVVCDRRRVSFVLQHNAHISGVFAKATGTVEEVYLFARRLEDFLGL